MKDDELKKWYRDRVVWGNRDFNKKMLANGLFARLHTPALLMMGLRVRSKWIDDAAPCAAGLRDITS